MDDRTVKAGEILAGQLQQELGAIGEQVRRRDEQRAETFDQNGSFRTRKLDLSDETGITNMRTMNYMNTTRMSTGHSV